MKVTINREGNAVNVRIAVLPSEKVTNRQIMDSSVVYFQSALQMLKANETVENIHFLINGFEVSLFK